MELVASVILLYQKYKIYLDIQALYFFTLIFKNRVKVLLFHLITHSNFTILINLLKILHAYFRIYWHWCNINVNRICYNNNFYSYDTIHFSKSHPKKQYFKYIKKYLRKGYSLFPYYHYRLYDNSRRISNN